MYNVYNIILNSDISTDSVYATTGIKYYFISKVYNITIIILYIVKYIKVLIC